MENELFQILVPLFQNYNPKDETCTRYLESILKERVVPNAHSLPALIRIISENPNNSKVVALSSCFIRSCMSTQWNSFSPQNQHQLLFQLLNLLRTNNTVKESLSSVILEYIEFENFQDVFIQFLVLSMSIIPSNPQLISLYLECIYIAIQCIEVQHLQQEFIEKVLTSLASFIQDFNLQGKPLLTVCRIFMRIFTSCIFQATSPPPQFMFTSFTNLLKLFQSFFQNLPQHPNTEQIALLYYSAQCIRKTIMRMESSKEEYQFPEYPQFKLSIIQTLIQSLPTISEYTVPKLSFKLMQILSFYYCFDFIPPELFMTLVRLAHVEIDPEWSPDVLYNELYGYVAINPRRSIQLMLRTFTSKMASSNVIELINSLEPSEESAYVASCLAKHSPEVSQAIANRFLSNPSFHPTTIYLMSELVPYFVAIKQIPIEPIMNAVKSESGVMATVGFRFLYKLIKKGMAPNPEVIAEIVPCFPFFYNYSYSFFSCLNDDVQNQLLPILVQQTPIFLQQLVEINPLECFDSCCQFLGLIANTNHPFIAQFDELSCNVFASCFSSQNYREEMIIYMAHRVAGGSSLTPAFLNIIFTMMPGEKMLLYSSSIMEVVDFAAHNFGEQFVQMNIPRVIFESLSNELWMSFDSSAQLLSFAIQMDPSLGNEEFAQYLEQLASNDPLGFQVFSVVASFSLHHAFPLSAQSITNWFHYISKKEFRHIKDVQLQIAGLSNMLRNYPPNEEASQILAEMASNPNSFIKPSSEVPFFEWPLF